MPNMHFRKILLLAVLLSGLPQAIWAANEDGKVIAVIVSAQSPLANELHANELPLIYWRKKLYGAHGQSLRPANLHAEHPLRLLFSDWVLRSSPAAQIGYWNGLYFHGVQPPFSVQSEEAMIRYVADNDDAMGYVDACRLDTRVKAIFWIGAGKMGSEAPVLHCDASKSP